ncbi:MAG: PH domain-containing protein [Actinomycetota bacterium]|nr:PH domain-containing protein [Actinomycetota bacterium]
MAFRTADLGQSEDMVADLRPHWSVLMPPGVLSAVVLASAVTLDLLFPGMPVAALVLLVLCIFASAAYFAWAAVKRASVHYVLTTDRIVMTWGVLSRHGRELPLWRVADLSYRQTVLQRVLRSGTVSIYTGAGERPTDLAHVPGPDRLHHAVWVQVEGGRRRRRWVQEGSGKLTVPEQLEKLYELKRRGAISDEQFRTQTDALFDS